jgi:hypothetical protein
VDMYPAPENCNSNHFNPKYFYTKVPRSTGKLLA